MNIGISTGCFYPEKTKKSLIKVAESGAKYTEIFFNTDSELDENYVRELRKIADENKIKVLSIHPYTSAIETFMFFSKNDYKLADSIKYYEKYFRACQILGAKYVVIHGCYITAEYMTIKRYTNNLNLLSKKAREYGVYISQENVVRFKCGYSDNLLEFVKYADKDIKFVFDLKQAIRAKQDPYQVLDIMGKRISHIHISDSKGNENSLLPGRGTFNLKKLLSYAENRFNIDAALIEVYNENIDSSESLKNSLYFLID